MPVIREFRCNDCGTTFESMSQDPECPNCSAVEPERVFLTPPGIVSPQTARKDEIVRDLAQAHGMSDMSNAGGAPVRRPPAQNPATFSTDNRVVAQLQKIGAAGDGLSAVLPTLRNSSNPTWGVKAAKEPLRQGRR